MRCLTDCYGEDGFYNPDMCDCDECIERREDGSVSEDVNLKLISPPD